MEDFSKTGDPNMYLQQMYECMARHHGDEDRCMKILQGKVTDACVELDWTVSNHPVLKVQLQNLFTEMNKDLLNLPYLM